MTWHYGVVEKGVNFWPTL